MTLAFIGTALAWGVQGIRTQNSGNFAPPRKRRRIAGRENHMHCLASARLLLSAAALLSWGVGARADSIFLSTPAGSTDAAGEPVSAAAHVVTSTDTVAVTLQNLTVNPRSIGENISDFAFRLT